MDKVYLHQLRIVLQMPSALICRVPNHQVLTSSGYQYLSAQIEMYQYDTCGHVDRLQFDHPSRYLIMDKHDQWVRSQKGTLYLNWFTIVQRGMLIYLYECRNDCFIQHNLSDNLCNLATLSIGGNFLALSKGISRLKRRSIQLLMSDTLLRLHTT